MTARQELIQLQIEQRKHDRAFSHDIWVLPLDRRLVHMALHFAKYTGYIAELEGQNHADSERRVIIDTFIISLASANALNTLLANHLITDLTSASGDLNALGEALAGESSYAFDGQSWLLRAMAVPTGRMAKALESMDHLEAYPSREAVTNSVIDLSRIALIAAWWRQLPLLSATRQRWRQVEERHIFCDQQ